MQILLQRTLATTTLAVIFLALVSSCVRAQVIISGKTHTGSYGEPGYKTPPGGGSFVFFNDNFTGGVGLNPNNNNEIAGAGLVIDVGSAAVIQSGVYRGGDGGLPSGFLIPGGDGLDNVTTLDTTILGGTFIGGFEGSPGFSVNSGVPYIPNPVAPIINKVFIYGGTFLRENQDGSFGDGGILANESTVTLYGSHLAFLEGDGTSTGTSGFGNGYVSGILADGSEITHLYYDALGAGRIVLVNDPAPVPEASTTISLGLLLILGIGSGMIASKRKKASAA